MSTLAPTNVQSRTRHRRRWWLWATLGLLVLITGAIGCLYGIARSALPQLDGTIAVNGLTAPVKIIRDHHGVPTVEAANPEDLFFAQGFVTAQDRLWQMDILRRFGAGELSEILGDETLKLDREQRILGLRAAAARSLQMADERDATYLSAYARGVNAFIETHWNRLPLEFRILNYRPKAWSPEDSIVIANQMVKDLNFYPFHDTLNRERILAQLGPELTADLYVNRSWHDRPPTVMREDLNQQEDDQDSDDDDDGPDNSVTRWMVTPQEIWDFQVPEAVNGSNNWVVSGQHTVTGKPLLSNDMHLGHQMPNLWYEAHLKFGNFDVVGVTLPGMPYVIVGHNQRIAWGFTNVGPTVTDAYIEHFNSQGEYQTPQGWAKPEYRTEVIRVRGKAEVTLHVAVTRHGPIVAELLPGETRQMALRWTLYDGLRMPFFDVDSAQNWQDFRKAFSKLDAPGQNVVYADVDGNIGYQTTGKIPIRASGDGSLPVSGADDAHEWTGYIPFDKLPTVFNPPSGVIATANGRITPDKYPYSISVEWEAPWRSERIYHVLESGRQFSPADMLALENDIHSENDLFAAERFVYAVDHAADASPRAKKAADLMRNWDGRMSVASAAPTIAVRSAQELTRLLLEPKLGRAPEDPEAQKRTLSWKTYHWQMQSVWLQNVMLHQPTRWLPEKYKKYDELLTAAVEAAVSEPEAPKNLSSWRWGEVNALDVEHPLFGKIPLLRHWAGPGMKEQSGSGYTVKAVTPHHGPSERFTANLANLDESTLNLVTGEGGNFLSPYYVDQWQAWYRGTTFSLPFSSLAVAANRAHGLVLEPAK